MIGQYFCDYVHNITCICISFSDARLKKINNVIKWIPLSRSTSDHKASNSVTTKALYKLGPFWGKVAKHSAYSLKNSSVEDQTWGTNMG